MIGLKIDFFFYLLRIFWGFWIDYMHRAYVQKP